MSLQAIAARTGRYAVVGGVCAGAYNVVMIAGAWFGAHYLVSSFAAAAIVAPLGYALHVAYTFKEPACWRGFLRFSAGIAAGFPVSLAVVAFLCSGLGLSAAVAAPVATLALVLWNYANAHWAILGTTSPR